MDFHHQENKQYYLCSPVQRSVFIKVPLFTWQDLSNSPLIQLLNNLHITMMEQEEYMYSNVTFIWKSFKDSCHQQFFCRSRCWSIISIFKLHSEQGCLVQGLLLVMSFPTVSVMCTANGVKVKNSSSAYRTVPRGQNT